MNRSVLCCIVAATALVAMVPPVLAQKAAVPGAPALPADYIPPSNPPSTELLHSSTVRILQSDYDTQLLRLPPDSRLGFGADIDRINVLLRTILFDKTMAAEARKSGVASDPEVAARIDAETDRILSQAVMDRNEAKWGKEFDTRPNIDEAARERWLVQKDKYRSPDEVTLTLLFYANARHPDAGAMAAAARAKIIAGADMAAIAKAESDDPAVNDNGGHIDWTNPKRLEPRVARAVAALRKPGDITEPVRSGGGVYLVRLDGRRGGDVRPFESVRPEIIAEMRRAYIDEQKAKLTASIRNDPTIVVNQPAVDKLVTRVDPAVLKGVPPMTLPSPPAGMPR